MDASEKGMIIRFTPHQTTPPTPAKWLVRHSSTPPKQQLRSLPSLSSDSSSVPGGERSWQPVGRAGYSAGWAAGRLEVTCHPKRGHRTRPRLSQVRTVCRPPPPWTCIIYISLYSGPLHNTLVRGRSRVHWGLYLTLGVISCIGGYILHCFIFVTKPCISPQ